ncbi:MAG: GNAT family N-acetyltransferase [Gammaproteobacteria bacterium]
MAKNDFIILETYNPEWEKLAHAEIEQLKQTLSSSILTIEHIGSTAVKDMPAKPVIDLMIGVNDIRAAKKLIPIIEAQGYAYWKENPKTDRLFFVKGLPEKGGAGRSHHLHIVERHHYEYIVRPLFRDYLQKNTLVSAAYAKLKQSLAQQYKEDREAYTVAKTDFINRISHLALIEAIRITPLEANDMELMYRWFNQAHVQHYYSLRAWTHDEVKNKLTPYLKKDSSVKGFIISARNEPIAYVQYCKLSFNPWPDQDFSDEIINRGVGIDFFIGEPSFIGQGLGSKIITAFLEQIIWPTYEFCAADPDVSNIASINTLKKSGFTSHKIILDINPLNQPVKLQLMIKKRPDIFTLTHPSTLTSTQEK